jgi:hypothetical protein
MEKYRSVTPEELNTLLMFNRDFLNKPEDCSFEVECGRGSYLKIMNLLCEEMQPTAILVNNNLIPNLNLQVGCVIEKVFIAGFGMLKITHNSRFDKGENREMSYEIIGSLPKSSYGFELFKLEGDKKISLLESTTLVELPTPSLFQRFKNWLKHFFI